MSTVTHISAEAHRAVKGLYLSRGRRMSERASSKLAGGEEFNSICPVRWIEVRHPLIQKANALGRSLSWKGRE